MNFSIGIKSDPIEYRFTFEWLFALCRDLDIRYVQLGSFFELYSCGDGYFRNLRDLGDKYRVRIKSCFTSHRELGGFFSGDPFLEKAARKNYERYIEAASFLGADYMGSNPGSVFRDRMNYKQEGIDCYLRHMKELMVLAKEKGLKALTMEPMSSSAEPPSIPEELDYMLSTLREHHSSSGGTTVPVFLCGDISHGFADKDKKIVHSNMDLFAHELPFMAEFHFKNTDAFFDSTFGFSKEEQVRGIVDLRRVKKLLDEKGEEIPVDHLVGYFETGGPKLGRDYSDGSLKEVLTESVKAIQDIFT